MRTSPLLLLVLDEPSPNLDPRSRRELLEVLADGVCEASLTDTLLLREHELELPAGFDSARSGRRPKPDQAESPSPITPGGHMSEHTHAGTHTHEHTHDGETHSHPHVHEAGIEAEHTHEH